MCTNTLHSPSWPREAPSAPPGTHLEAKDDGPDEAQDQAVVAIHDVMGAHVFQMHTLLLEEL